MCSGAFYVFGNQRHTNDITRFDEVTNKWSVVGNLIIGRTRSSVVFDGLSHFIIVGGLDNAGKPAKTEKCMTGMYDGSTVTVVCIELESSTITLNKNEYPALFLTDDKYADDC